MDGGAEADFSEAESGNRAIELAQRLDCGVFNAAFW